MEFGLVRLCSVSHLVTILTKVNRQSDLRIDLDKIIKSANQVCIIINKGFMHTTKGACKRICINIFFEIIVFVLVNFHFKK